MDPVSIKIYAKIGAASFEIESGPEDVLHHQTGPEFMKALMDLAGFIGPADAEIDAPTRQEVRPNEMDNDDGPAEIRTESSMGSVDEFLRKGGRRTDLDDGRVMEEEAIFTPGSDNADRPAKTFGSRVEYGDSPEEQKKAEAMKRINDADGWAQT